MSIGLIRRSPPPPLHWRSWPIEEGGATAWFLACVLGGFMALAGWQTGSAPWALVAGAAMATAAWRYFLPVHYEINSQGVFQTAFGRRQRISWRSIGRVEVGHEGVLISPGGGLAGTLRGVYLPWGSHRAEMLALLDYYLQQFHPDERLMEDRFTPATFPSESPRA